MDEVERLKTIHGTDRTQFEDWLAIAITRWPELSDPRVRRIAQDAWDVAYDVGCAVNY